jgi:hypothetical protein
MSAGQRRFGWRKERLRKPGDAEGHAEVVRWSGLDDESDGLRRKGDLVGALVDGDLGRDLVVLPVGAGLVAWWGNPDRAGGREFVGPQGDDVGCWLRNR